MSEPYAIDARYYDLIHDGHDDDIGLWQSFALRTSRPVLEIGCGSGRIAVELAGAGAAVTGIDPSPAMLALARDRAAAAGVTLDLREAGLPGGGLEAGRYGFVLVPQDVFLHLEDGEAQRAALTEIAEAMAFDATLAIDLPGPAQWLDPSTDGQPMLAWTGETEDGLALDVWHVKEDDLARQVRWLRVSYETTAEDGTVRRQSTEHWLRYPGRFEMEYLLDYGGLALVDVFGDYDLGPLTNGSERMIVTARRKRG
ncbi:MAG: class I SAM-dependent methyltransferase [Thermoflexaceae bacterium]|jgi:SAM-dependent methyltransferase|nr:class I SAM-dependent methyltransferase [Thermoflexaceae bacterium]